MLVLLAAAATTASATGTPDGRFAIHTWSVDEHTDAVLVRDHRAPVVYVSLEFPVGTWSAWAREADVRTAMAIQIHDPDAKLRRRADALAARLWAGAFDRHSSMNGWCLAGDFDGLVDLMRDVLANERFDRKELKRWKRQAKLSWRASETDVWFRGRRLAARSLFRPGDPRRRPYERPRRVETDGKELVRIRDAIVRQPGRTIGLAGDLTIEQAEALSATLLPPADPRSRVDAKPALLPLRPREERSDSETAIRRLTQVYFALGRESCSYSDPSYPAFVLANHVLGGHFYSRIMVALRHEGGDTYGAFARAETGVAPGPFAIGSFTRTANAPYAEEKLRETLRVFHADGITEQERAEAVSHLTGKAPFERQAPHQVLDRRMKARRLGLPAGFFDDLPRRAATWSLHEINAFIAEYYDPDAFVMGRIAPEK